MVVAEEGSPYFNNEGTFLKSAGSGTTINITFNNSGIVDIASGTLTLNQGGTCNGTFTGPGNLSVTGGALTLASDIQNLIVAGGTINGVNASISNLTWSSGTLQGSNIVTGTAT